MSHFQLHLTTLKKWLLWDHFKYSLLSCILQSFVDQAFKIISDRHAVALHPLQLRALDLSTNTYKALCLSTKELYTFLQKLLKLNTFLLELLKLYTFQPKSSHPPSKANGPPHTFCPLLLDVFFFPEDQMTMAINLYIVFLINASTLLGWIRQHLHRVILSTLFHPISECLGSVSIMIVY